jgi:hypothetical protein
MNKVSLEAFKKKAQSVEASKLVQVIAGRSAANDCHPGENCGSGSAQD